ncbi:MAG: M1 family aminopeptidase [Saprospiraceae bacterium]
MTTLYVGKGKYEVDFEQIGNKLWIREASSKGDTSEYVIKYSGIPYDGLIISKNKFGHRCFFGDNWPDRAQNWLSCIDHPSDKALVEFEIEAPSHYTVVASGKLIEEKAISDNNNYFHFKTDVALPTKVMVIAVADFIGKNYGEVDGIPVSSLIFSGNSDAGLSDYESSVEALRFYIDKIGEYPYQKLVNIQSKTRYGGMENAGNIFYFENSVTGMKQVEDLIAHEVAHQWFGNSVTELDWHHIWLSEGFATYLADLYIENKYGDNVFKRRMESEREKVINYNFVNPNPIIDTTITDWNELLNPNSYEKAAWLLHMLRNKIGDDDFYKSLEKYYLTYQNGNALTKDFVNIVNGVTGKDMRSFFAQWLYRKSYPELDIKWKYDADNVLIEVNQKNKPFTIDLPMSLSDGMNTRYFNLKIEGSKEQFIFSIKNLFDSKGKLIMKVDPDIKVLQKNSLKYDSDLVMNVPVIQGFDFIREGDLLFQDLDCGGLCDAIESVTSGYRGSKLSHVGIAAKKNGELMVVEAIGGKVHYTSAEDFLDRYYDYAGRPKVIVGRLKDTFGLVNDLKNIEGFIDKAYDDIYDIENDKYYCSELVYFVYNQEGKPCFELSPMTFKPIGSDEYFPAWIEYFNSLNKKIPEGQLGLNPGSISRSDKIDIIYRFGDPDGYGNN